MVSDGFVVSVTNSVMVRRSRTTILPCWISPTQSAEGLEVRWYRSDDFYSHILLYKERKIQEMSQEAYVGRISFGLHDTASGGLATGDVSLKLGNVTLEDTGDYTCYVSSEKGYDSGIVSLIVTGECHKSGKKHTKPKDGLLTLTSNVLHLPPLILPLEIGAPVLLSTQWKDDNIANVSCESGGWYPEPEVRWSDQKQVLRPEGLKHSKDSSGLLSVHSWLLVSGSSEVSCSVGLPHKEGKEARVRLEKPPQLDKSESGSSAAGWVAFALLLIATLVGIGVLWFKMRETQKLLSKVNVTLDKVENRFLTIRDCMLRDAPVEFPDGEKVTCLTAIKGTPGFSSGQHYWEVSLAVPGIDVKKSWWVGVTSVVNFPEETDFTPTTAKGFWFLSSSPDIAQGFQFSTEAKVSLPVNSRPQTVGVYLNYDSGDLSFYNVEEESLIGSLTVRFTGKVFPFFNPGKGDQACMKILQRKEESQPADVGISEGTSLMKDKKSCTPP
ncbi:hypothetical protein L3Q82_004071 [Scortum barcoo]|uniref:Uncharacterized protein n=1 Tax=Scortum barcoo TaxID=214431 RepID=A0ACB8X733_9TELE|nr:hypothetical protein L3Q82_004071 [Scortum barcoo]